MPRSCDIRDKVICEYFRSNHLQSGFHKSFSNTNSGNIVLLIQNQIKLMK